ncbi:mechanosensitive ion channel family protein [Swingsia samuiensis]|nr:mechanosensitive ion channel family protein [Swingsia samuiensis]
MRLLIQVICSVVLFCILFFYHITPVDHPSVKFSSIERLSFLTMSVAAWWAATRALIILMRIIVNRKNDRNEVRILSDVLSGLIFISFVVLAISFLFEVPVKGLVATSGVVAIVIGLALQSTLSDLFSGIAVGIEKPYRLGDVISLDNGAAGRVVQVNWRSTHLQTTDHDLIVVPNNLVAKAKLINRSMPSPLTSQTLELRVHPAVPIDRVRRVIREALHSCSYLSHAGATTYVECLTLGGDGNRFLVGFSAATYGLLTEARAEALAQVQRHLFHSGIPLTVANRYPEGEWTGRLLSPEELLARSELFGCLSDHGREKIASVMKSFELREGQVLFQAGDPPESLYIISTGTVKTVPQNRVNENTYYVLGPGESLGTVALITGEPYKATARALSLVHGFRLDAKCLAHAIEENPELAEELEKPVKNAIASMMKAEQSDVVASDNSSGGFFKRLRSLLNKA